MSEIMTEFTCEQTKAITATVEEWDLSKTVKRASEELLELALSLLHMDRGKVGVNAVLEEMADVRIVLKHLEIRFGDYQEELDRKVIKGNQES